jgi:hypothetical protein
VSVRYFATRLLGDGTEKLLAEALPIGGGRTTQVLTGHNSLQGTITPELARLQTTTGPLFEPWSTCIYAEVDKVIVGAGILNTIDTTGPQLTLDCVGFTAYPDGMPYIGEWSRIGVDPIAAFRQAWAHLQTQPAGNLGLDVDTTAASPVRLGKPGVPAYTEAQIGTAWLRTTTLPPGTVEPPASSALAAAITATAATMKLTKLDRFGQLRTPFDVTVGDEVIRVGAVNQTTLVCSGLTRGVGSTSPGAHSKGVQVNRKGTNVRTVPAVAAEPYVLADWCTDDLGAAVTTLAKDTPFDWVESHAWDGDTIAHTLRLGYPRIGRRRPELRFVAGENVTVDPKVSWSGEEYADEVLMLGAGEGRKMVRARAFRDSARLRRVAVVADSRVRSQASANAAAARAVALRRGLPDVTEITVTRATPGLGDEIRLLGSGTGWAGKLDVWVRVLSITRSPDDTDRATLTVRRADKGAES